MHRDRPAKQRDVTHFQISIKKKQLHTKGTPKVNRQTEGIYIIKFLM
jgi:hypothetical protein